MTEAMLYEITDGIARVTFNRPEARNAFTFAMYDELVAICEAISRDKAVRAVVMTGAGSQAFASGTDIAQFRDFASADDAIRYERRLERAIDAVERCRAPTIAAMSGACTGGGAAIAAACDLRLAAADFRFGFPVARTLGNCLSLMNHARLVALIGPARVRDIMFTARLVAAEDARAMGLISEVLPDHGALMTRADALAREIAANAPLTIKATKEALLRLRAAIPPGADDDLITMCYMSADFHEGMTAFLEKRPARFKGE